MSKRTRSQLRLPDLSADDTSFNVSPLKGARQARRKLDLVSSLNEAMSSTQSPTVESDDEILLSPKKKRTSSPDDSQRAAKRAKLGTIFCSRDGDRPSRPKGNRKITPSPGKGTPRAHSVPVPVLAESSRAIRVASVPPVQRPEDTLYSPPLQPQNHGHLVPDPQEHFRWAATLSPIPVARSIPPLSAEGSKTRPTSPPRSSSALSSELSSPPNSDHEPHLCTPRAGLGLDAVPSSPLTPIPPTPHPNRPGPTLGRDGLVPLKGSVRSTPRTAGLPLNPTRNGVGDGFARPPARAPFGHSRSASETQQPLKTQPNGVRSKTLGLDAKTPTAKPPMIFGHGRSTSESQRPKTPGLDRLKTSGESSNATATLVRKPSAGKSAAMKQSTLNFGTKPAASCLPRPPSLNGLSNGVSNGTIASTSNGASTSALPSTTTPRRLSVKDRMKPKTPRPSAAPIVDKAGLISAIAGTEPASLHASTLTPLDFTTPSGAAAPAPRPRPKAGTSRSMPSGIGGRVTRSTSSKVSGATENPKPVPKVKAKPPEKASKPMELASLFPEKLDKGKGKEPKASPFDMEVDGNETEVEPTSSMGSPMRMTPNVSIDRIRVDLTPPPAYSKEQPPSADEIARALEGKASVERGDDVSMEEAPDPTTSASQFTDMMMPVKMDAGSTPVKLVAPGTPRSSIKNRMKPKSAPGTSTPHKISTVHVGGPELGSQTKTARDELNGPTSTSSVATTLSNARTAPKTPSKSNFSRPSAVLPKSMNGATKPIVASRKSAAAIKTTVANFNGAKKQTTKAPVKDGKLSSFFVPSFSKKQGRASSSSSGSTTRAPSSLTNLAGALDRLNLPPPSRPNTSMGFSLDDDLSDLSDEHSLGESTKGGSKDDGSEARKPSSIGLGRPGLQRSLTHSGGSMISGSSAASSSKDRPSSMFAPAIARSRPALPNAPAARTKPFGMTMGGRMGSKASRKTTLESVEASPVKGQGGMIMDEDEKMDAMQPLHAQSERTPIPRAAGLSDVFDESELVMNDVKPVKESSRATKEAWVKQTSSRASMASRALSQSLSSLPKIGSMGPPPVPIGRAASSSYPTSQATTRNGGSKTAPGAFGKGKGGHVSKSGKNNGEGRLEVLKGCVFFVDVRDSAGEDTGGFFADMLKDMGGKILTRVGQTCTHIIFKNGLMSTVTRYRLLNEPKPHVVGIAWVVECAEQLSQADEAGFKLDLNNYNVAGGVSKRRRSMLPKSISQEEGEANSMSFSSQDDSLEESSSSMILDGEDDLPPLERARRRKLLLPNRKK